MWRKSSRQLSSLTAYITFYITVCRISVNLSWCLVLNWACHCRQILVKFRASFGRQEIKCCLCSNPILLIYDMIYWQMYLSWILNHLFHIYNVKVANLETHKVKNNTSVAVNMAVKSIIKYRNRQGEIYVCNTSRCLMLYVPILQQTRSSSNM